MCLVNCPFGAIADKSQIFQVIRAIQSRRAGLRRGSPRLCGPVRRPRCTPGKLRAAMKQLGFADIFEVAIGADLCATQEAEDFIREVPEELPFMGTSCCPAWSVMAKKLFPDYARCVSMALTPMTLTARLHQASDHPHGKVVFIGPCAAKKLEAMRKSVRSEVDFVLTFEEMAGMMKTRRHRGAGNKLPVRTQSGVDGRLRRRPRTSPSRAAWPSAVVNAIQRPLPRPRGQRRQRRGPRELPQDDEGRRQGQVSRLPARGHGLSGRLRRPARARCSPSTRRRLP